MVHVTDKTQYHFIHWFIHHSEDSNLEGMVSVLLKYMKSTHKKHKYPQKAY